MRGRAHAATLWLALIFLAGGCVAEDTGSKGEIVIATDGPTSGAARASGRGPEAGAAYALQQRPTVKGFKLTLQPYDDAVNGSPDPQRGAQNFADMVGNPKILSVIGPFNSNVARATIRVANRAELAMISPSNTLNCLTVDPSGRCDAFGGTPASFRESGRPNNYFRLAAPDIVLGTAMADFAIGTLKLQKVAVFSDSNPGYGLTVADAFARRFQAKGGAVVVRQDYPTEILSQKTQPPDFRPFLLRARDAGAQGIFAGATTGTSACLARAQAKGILDVYLLGPDGIGDVACIRSAGEQASETMYYALSEPRADLDPANKSLIDAFGKTFPQKDDLSTYTFAGYDCAMILIDAIGRAIDAAAGKLPTRRQVLDAVRNTKSLKLSTGVYTFDDNGDTTTPTIAIYQLKNSLWTFLKQFSVAL